MGLRLPLVAPHAREHTYCAYCPKLCRHTCPVSTTEGRETTTPWGKMTALHRVDVGTLPPHAEFAETWYACTGCLACRDHCEHGNEVAAALFAGRSEAVRLGIAPAGAHAVLAAHEGRVGSLRQRAPAVFGDACSAKSPVAHVPGCTATALEPDVARRGLEATAKLTGKAPRAVADRCCGLPLLEAGDQEGFIASLRAFVSRLDESELAVFVDPGCMHAVTQVGPRFGVKLRARAVHFTELAASEHARLEPLTPSPAGPMRYHDPCRLGRGLGIVEAPRGVLAHLLGRAPDEFDGHGPHGRCTGGGGQLPRVQPETAAAIAGARAQEHAALGGGRVITACATSTRQLRSAGADVVAFSDLVAESLGIRGPAEPGA